jgi:hypothetical protein
VISNPAFSVNFFSSGLAGAEPTGIDAPIRAIVFPPPDNILIGLKGFHTPWT